jgi:hypothetical protein
MAEWWTYALSDLLLFSPQAYYRVIERYNAAIWPAQLGFLALGIAVLVLLHRGGVARGRVAAALFAASWLWLAGDFLWRRYATINWAATYFAAAFAVQALLLFYCGVVRNRLRGPPTADGAARIGLGLYLFALLAYPFVAPLLGRPWTQAEVFGAAPDPTAMATVGIILFASSGPRWQLLAIPILWCALSGATLWAMKSPEALLLPLAAVVALSLARGKREGSGQAG